MTTISLTRTTEALTPAELGRRAWTKLTDDQKKKVVRRLKKARKAISPEKQAAANAKRAEAMEAFWASPEGQKRRADRAANAAKKRAKSS